MLRIRSCSILVVLLSSGYFSSDAFQLHFEPDNDSGRNSADDQSSRLDGNTVTSSSSGFNPHKSFGGPGSALFSPHVFPQDTDGNGRKYRGSSSEQDGLPLEAVAEFARSQNLSKTVSIEAKSTGRTLAQVDYTNTSLFEMVLGPGAFQTSAWKYAPGANGGCSLLQSVPIGTHIMWRFNGTFLFIDSSHSIFGKVLVYAHLVDTMEGAPQTFQGIFDLIDQRVTFTVDVAHLSGTPEEIIPPCSGHGSCYLDPVGKTDATYCICDEGFQLSPLISSECVPVVSSNLDSRYVQAGTDATANSGFRSDPFANLSYALQMSVPNASDHFDGEFKELTLLPGTYVATTHPMVYVPVGSSIQTITSTNGSSVTILDCDLRTRGFVIAKDALQISGITIRSCWAWSATWPLGFSAAPRSSEQLPAHPLYSSVEFGWNNEGLGGGVLVGRGVELEIVNVTIEHCRASYLGGGVAVQFDIIGDPTSQALVTTIISFKDSVLHNNTAGCGGGALVILDLNPDLLLEGTNITDNRASYGGALFLDLGIARITTRKCRFERNQAASGGAIMVPYDASLTVLNSYFDFNEALESWHAAAVGMPLCFADTSARIYPGSGGALDLQEAEVSITDTVFSNCFATRGGAISTQGSPRKTWSAPSEPIFNTLLRVEFVNNKVTKYGGAVYVKDASYVVQSSHFSSNSGNMGGGLMAAGGNMIALTNTAMVNNSANGKGGALLVRGGRIELRSSVVRSNYAATYGGALHCNEYGHVIAEGCTYDFNAVGKVGYGGALSLSPSCNLSVVDATISHNFAGIEGGALHVQPGSGSVLDLRSVHLVENLALLRGGALALTNLESADLALSDLVFTRNSCQEGGGGAAVTDFPIQCNNCQLINNSALYADDFTTTDFTLLPKSPPYNTSGVVYTVSGEVLPILVIQIVDSYLNDIELASYTDMLVLETNASHISGNQARLIDGSAAFAAVILKSRPGSSLQLLLSWRFNSGSPLRHLNFTVLVQECSEGEGLSQDLLVCEMCSAHNGYSISPGQPCVLCNTDQVVEGLTCVSKDNKIPRIWVYLVIALAVFVVIISFFFLLRLRLAQIKLQEQEEDHLRKQYGYKDRENKLVRSNRAFIDHQLKNKFAAACFAIESLLMSCVAENNSQSYSLYDPYSYEGPGMELQRTLLDCQEEMEDGLMICTTQQTYEKVLQRTYVLQSRSIDLRQMLRRYFTRKIKWEVEEGFPIITLDATLLVSLLSIGLTIALRNDHSGEATPRLHCRLRGSSGEMELEVELSNESVAGQESSLSPHSTLIDTLPSGSRLLEMAHEIAALLGGKIILKGTCFDLVVAVEVSRDHTPLPIEDSTRVADALTSASRLMRPPLQSYDVQPEIEGFEWSVESHRLEAPPSTVGPLALGDVPKCGTTAGSTANHGETLREVTSTPFSIRELHPKTPHSHSIPALHCDDGWPSPQASIGGKDNQLMLCIMKHLVLKVLKGSQNSIFCGNDKSDILGVGDKVLFSDPPVDICILDQNLDDPRCLEGPPVLLGTEIIRKLMLGGYTGITIIRSANDSDVDIAEYFEAGASGVLKKTDSIAQSAHQIGELWKQHIAHNAF
ncbi:hypothetical protein CYMTET_13224 [Cymbomonas tetramitiformis]|uniref:Uncharacterized protein n=1 Tax=Cymbomonas tetramitiformis TaxID=36881 RepID=A0AAE0GIK1_9CHLO|nr:hypothetical protein CYMTET_13224 [Cymbomonas tetramitiformis]